MKTTLLILTFFTAALLTGVGNAGETVISNFSWREVADRGRLVSGELVDSPDGQTALKVENRGSTALHAKLLDIEQPKITTAFYAVSGEVKYENVEGDGFLEMWNYFGASAAYFSRTLGESGPMGKLQGSADWHPFILPFDATGADGAPNKLSINLSLPGKGVVFLRGLKLAQNTSFGASQQVPGAWWSDRAAGYIGGIAGSLIGCLGSLTAWLAAQGRAQHFVMNALRMLIALGVIAVVAGLTAVALRQPYHVWCVLLLIGGLCLLIIPFRLRRYETLYRELELRRMSAMDLAVR